MISHNLYNFSEDEGKFYYWAGHHTATDISEVCKICVLQKVCRKFAWSFNYSLGRAPHCRGKLLHENLQGYFCTKIFCVDFYSTFWGRAPPRHGKLLQNFGNCNFAAIHEDLRISTLLHFWSAVILFGQLLLLSMLTRGLNHSIFNSDLKLKGHV